MTETTSGSAAALLAGGTAAPVGTWSCDPGTETWTWSPEIYAFLGFEPGQVLPTTDLLVAHVLPTDDGAGLAAADAALAGGRPISVNLRVRDARNRERTLLLVGEREAGDAGGYRGFMVDLTDWQRSTSEEDIRDGIEAAAEFRGAIDQAKGALSALFGMSADEAFATLVRFSQDANVKVREVATRLVRHLADVGPGPDRATGPDELLGLATADRADSA